MCATTIIMLNATMLYWLAPYEMQEYLILLLPLFLALYLERNLHALIIFAMPPASSTSMAKTAKRV